PNIFTCSSYHGVISRTARAGIRQVIEDAEAQSFPKLVVEPCALGGFLEGENRLLGHGGGAATDQPLDPVIRCFIMKSRPRGLALTTGCQHSTGWCTGRGTRVISRSS